MPTCRVIFALMMREMSTSYGRSAGGYLWVILEPAAGIALMSIAFGLFLKSPPLGENFALFYATGLLPFVIYTEISGKVSQTIRFSRPLLVYPKVTFIDAVFARFVLNLWAQAIVFCVVMSGIIWFFDLGVSPNFAAVGMSVFLAAFLGLSVGTLNILLFAFVPVWERVWSVINRPMLLISCIFYTYDGLPKSIRDIIWFNPIVHVVGLMRHALYSEYGAHYVSPSYVFLCCILLWSFGIYFLRLYHKKIMNEL
ncbi:capsular polysaccharide transport system permease protein [Litoreibacter albidus]|uniref:Capsular polysaccharide transport system permease protein n=1 Tax=Litoreibacter albidus TaxID=670155 RepID=A0A1H3D7H5_9RHOB|nr:capsular polysaccharide transport system permease protein [Litoreibacter albidus]